MAYRIAAIDVPKRVLMVVVASGAEEVKDPTGQALEFECRRFETLEPDRARRIEWLQERQGAAVAGRGTEAELRAEAEQRSWRDAAGAKDHYVAERVRLQNRVEALLEEMRIKLSGVISDLFGVSGRILAALAEGKTTDPKELAKLGDQRLACGQEKLADA